MERDPIAANPSSKSSHSGRCVQSGVQWWVSESDQYCAR